MKRRNPPTEAAIARMTDTPRRDVLTADERATVEWARSHAEWERAELDGDEIARLIAILDRVAPKGE